MPGRLVIFDVCDTLYATNTTVGFLRFVGERGNRRVGMAVRRWTSRSHPAFWLGALVHRLASRDLARERMVASLAGLDRQHLAERADDYVATVLPNFENHALLERLHAHQAPGDRVILASNSLEPVVSAIAKQLGTEAVSSLLEYSQGRCTGRIARDLTGHKAIAVRQLIGDTLAAMTVYTDNPSDADLVRLAERAVIVMPAGRRNLSWAGAEHEYLQL